MSTPVVYRLTLFADDGVTPWFGAVDVYGAITEADFQTPDPTLAHDRPYLRIPENPAPTEIDFLAGSSRIGAVSVGVLDRRITATDQSTGLVTSRIKDAPGSRAVLERWIEDSATWRRLMDGVVGSYSVDSEELLVYWFHLRDAREFEREQSLFFANHVLLGANGASGPSIDYGALPGGGYLLDAVEPWLSIDAGTISHFLRGETSEIFDRLIYWGLTPFPPLTDIPLFALIDYWGSVLESDGIYRYRDFAIRWREKGSADPWITLRAMPRASGNYAAAGPAAAIPNPDGITAGFLFPTAPTLYFGSFDEAEIPETGQEIEFLVLAEQITPKTPFWWDGGTLGDLLLEIVAGDHTEVPPRERYDAAALAAFALSSRPARLKLTAPVPDRRKWVEEHIYKASLTAPAFNLEKELRPVAWRTPTAAELAGAPVIDAETIQPIGEWEHGTDNAIGEVEYTYIREHLESPRTITEMEEPPWYHFGFGEATPREVLDPNDDRRVWERMVETPVTVRSVDPAASPGAQKLVYAPVTIRLIGGVDGRPIGGDTQNDLAVQIAEEARATVFQRFRRGAPKYAAEAAATTANLDLTDGQWVLVRFPPLPEYSTGRRGLSRYMQIYAIGDPTPAIRRLSLVDSGVPDVTAEGDAACLSGGTNTVLPDGSSAMYWSADGNLVNACDHDVTVQVLAIAGGGGGGTGGAEDTPGGGGAGGVLIVADVLIAAGATIPVTVGSGGAGGVSGEDTVLWAAPDGTPLVPGVDPPPVALRAIGGGRGGNAAGDGIAGGSGGGGGETYPISGGNASDGGPGTAGQGFAGGDGHSSGGLATCQHAAGGGGGSYGGPGADGDATDPAVNPTAAAGGPPTDLADWGVTAGGGGSAPHQKVQAGGVCGDVFAIPGATGTGIGAGGGGGGLGGMGGVLVVGFTGSAPATLAPPTVTSTDVETDGRVTVCVEEADWPPVALEGYRVRVDYAVGALEPDAASGDWRLAGYLEAPGCATTPPVPTGAKVWSRAIAEAPAFLPSEPNTATDSDTPETPGLLAYALTIDELGVATVTWTPNAFAGSIKIRGLIHDDAASVDRPLAFIADVAAATGTYALPGTVPQTESYTIDLEAWGSLGVDPGTVYRLSQQQPYGVELPDTTGVPAGALLGWDGSFPEWVTTISYANLPTGSGTWAFGAANALTLEGQLVVAAGTTGRAGLLLTVGVAPTGGGLVDGGIWVTTAGFFGRANGATVALGLTLPITAVQGGTGLTTYATGDLLYASAANTLSKLGIGATGNYLRVTAGVPTWSTLTLPNTIATGRVLCTNATDVVSSVAGVSGRVLVHDGTFPAFTTLPFGAMPAVSGTWDVGAGNTLTVTRQATFNDLLIVAAGGVMQLSYRADPAGPSNGMIWINSTSFELKYRANGVTYRVAAVTP